MAEYKLLYYYPRRGIRGQGDIMMMVISYIGRIK